MVKFETQRYVYFFRKKRKADKPSSVVPYHLSRTSITEGLHRPTLRQGTSRSLLALVGLFGLSTHEVYRAQDIADLAVVSYTPVSPLPRNLGGFFSVALAVKRPCLLLPTR